jgi:hypothetical protein
MGGKDSGGGSSFYASQNEDNDLQDLAMLEAMMGMMSGMTEAMATMATQVPEMPEPVSTPQLATTEPIDWAEKMSTLNAKTRADYANEVDKKKGRTDTIHTSPLLDEDETNTTSQTLIGS